MGGSLRDSFPEGMENPLLVEEPVVDEPMATDEPTPELPVDEPTAPQEPAMNEPEPQLMNEPLPQAPVGVTKEDLQAMLEETLAKQNQPKEEVAEPTEEDMEAMKEKWMDDFYSNPQNAIKNIIEEAITPYKQRIEEQDRQMEWNKKATSFLESRPDAKEMIEDIVEVLNQRPELQNAEDAYDIAYKLKMADKLMNKPEKEFTVDDAMNNEEIKKAIIEDYIKNLNSQENPPTLIGNQAGQAPLSAGEKPKTLADATRMYLGRKK